MEAVAMTDQTAPAEIAMGTDPKSGQFVLSPAIAEAFPEAAKAYADQHYWQTTQRALVRAQAAEQAKAVAAAVAVRESDGPAAAPVPAGETLTVPAPDGAPSVSQVRAIYEQSDSPAARDYLAAWPTFDHDLPRIQQAAADKMRAMGAEAWARMAEAFDSLSDAEQLQVMWSMRLDADAPSPSTKGTTPTMTTTTPAVPADLDLAIEQADAEFYRHFHNRDHSAMARADARRQALYRQRPHGTAPVVNGMRTS
jgi:hypothetical protein